MALSQKGGDKCPQDSMPGTLSATPRQVLLLLLVLCQQQSGGAETHHTCRAVMQWLLATGYWLGSLIDRGQWDSGSARSRGHACMHAADNVTLCLVSKNFKDFSLYRIFRHIYIILNIEKKITNYIVSL
jgi:hypothetical protein